MSTPGPHRSAGSPDGLVDTLDGVVDRGWDHASAEQVSAALEGAGPEAAMRIAAHLQIDLELSRFACEQPSAARLAAMLSEGHGTREVTKGVAGRRSLYAFAAAVCLAVAVPLWLFAATPQASTVGHLIALSDDATWSGTEYRPGDVVKEGQSLRLTSGTAGFVLEKGTRIELIAPAVLQVERSSRVRLRRGAIAARVPEQDIGFSVSTEDGQIVDLGTEFFVEYDVTAGTRVAVAEGQVKAAVFNSDGSQREFVRLTAGRVAQMDRLTETISEVGWAISWDDFADKVRRSRAGVASIGGVVRIASQAPEVLTELSRQTIDHVVLFTEGRGAASAESGIE
ncbi:MAG: FecR domain-containing protein, partial [Planctomycetota bacterium]